MSRKRQKLSGFILIIAGIIGLLYLMSEMLYKHPFGLIAIFLCIINIAFGIIYVRNIRDIPERFDKSIKIKSE